MKREAVIRQLKLRGYSDFVGVHKELTYLAGKLSDDETPLAAVRGFVNGFNTVLVVLTNFRIFFIDSGLVYGVQTSDIPLRSVNAISHGRGVFFCKLIITNGADNTFVKTVPLHQAERFIKDANNANIKLQNTLSGTTAAFSAADELTKYKRLLDQGVIDEQEFAEQKRKLLSRDE